ncbi:retinol-binding protein pinta-like [Solenopsis invicta]|uniref:retinol-binding protein pinta-like n=1 Tax=Solenopsis invicta TaxID=13686 RepID=UPI00193D493F|nr:retinol-binding protein pinta-like [Solenopsis invicta]XP_039302692.1 retinol-binding protein pinta-like [Solenopsis invicta]
MATGFDNSTVQHAQQELTSEDKKYAAENLNETDETRRNAVAEIKHWIEESDDLSVQNGDFLILRFLRTCKFDVEQTKDRIRNYYQQRSDLSEWYTNKDPFRPEMQELLDLGIFVPLRKPDSQGRIVFLMRPTLNDPNVHEIPNIMKICILMIETAMKYYPAGSIYGVAFYIDVSNPSTRQIFQYSPFVLKNLAHLWQKCYPMRYQKIVFFNASSILNVLISTLRLFLTEKLKNRFYVYSDQKCFEDIPSDTLPIEYGGTNGTMQELIEYWKRFIQKNRDWLMEEENSPSIEIEPIEEDFQQTHL